MSKYNWYDPSTELTLAVGAAGAGAASSSSGSPWQIRVADHGALGDGQLAHDAATNGTNTFTSAAVGATGKIGQWVIINGGRGTADTAAIGTITGIAGTSITIDTSARGLPVVGSASGLDVLWGSDDTAAINATVAVAVAYAEAHGYAADVMFDDKIYVVAGLTQSNDGNILYNTQIPVPRPTDNNGRKLVIGFKGAANNSSTGYWNATTPNLTGTVIASTQFGPNSMDATFFWQSVFGAGIPQGGNMAQALDVGHANPIFVNHKPVFENIQVVVPVYSNLTAFDLQESASAYVKGCSAYAFANLLYGNGTPLSAIWHSAVFGGKHSCGLRLPLGGNNADVLVPDFTAYGLVIALSTPSEHIAVGTLKSVYCAVVVQITTSGTGHGLVIERVTAEAYQGGIQNALTGGTGKVPVFIGLWNTETSATADGGGGYDISDPNNTLTGEIHWANTVDSGHQFPLVTGANNVRVVCESVYRGVQTPPAVPATTVALQNPFWRDAVVHLTGGTVTVVSVDGQTVATATGATVIVPTGKSITLTYSVAPTWTWALL